MNHELILFTLESDPQDLPPIKHLITIDHMIIPSYPKKKVARPNAQTFWTIYNTCRVLGPEVIHCTADGISNMFAMTGQLLSIPILGSFHTDLLDLLTTHNADPFQKFCVWLKERIDSDILDSCATTSTSFRDKLARSGLQFQHIIITAVDIKTFSPSKRNESLRNELTFGDPNAFLCVYVGRISKEKRMDVLIDAIRQLPGTYLAIIGDGPSGQTYAAMHGKQNRIHCKPRFLSHSELAEVYASSDIHVSASEFETLGNTVLEAFACKIPVVVPRTQGFCDTVADGETGFLFTPKSSDDCRRLILKLKEDVVLRKEMGERGFLTVCNRSITHVVNDLLDWYRLGQQRQREHTKKLSRFLYIFVILSGIIPFSIVALFVYDCLMTILLWFGYSPAESVEAAHPVVPKSRSSENSKDA